MERHCSLFRKFPGGDIWPECVLTLALTLGLFNSDSLCLVTNLHLVVFRKLPSRLCPAVHDLMPKHYLIQRLGTSCNLINSMPSPKSSHLRSLCHLENSNLPVASNQASFNFYSHNQTFLKPFSGTAEKD